MRSPIHAAPFVPWQYDGPPGLFDLAENAVFTRGVRLVLHLAVRLYLRRFHRLRIRRTRIPFRPASSLIVANHSSHLDVLALMSALRLREVNNVRSVAACDYFFEKPFRRTLAFLLGNTMPMDRTRFDWRAFRYCQEKLWQGANVIMFPSGTRSPDGQVGHFKPGVGLLALTAGVPVIPAHIAGGWECWGKGRVFPRRRRLEVHFGRPRYFGGLPNCKESWIRVSQELEEAVRGLATGPRREEVEHDRVVDGAA